MNLPLKNSSRRRECRQVDDRGSALTIVLFFAAIGMITVFSYLLHQMYHARPSLGSASTVQALFNARSGIYKALYLLVDSVATDTFETISTLDSTFGASMFPGVPDTTARKNRKPELDGDTVIYDLFPGDSLGDCKVTLEPAGGLCMLTSTGRYRSAERMVTAMLGCRIPVLPDTVVIYRNDYPWKGNSPRGTVVIMQDSSRPNISWFTMLIDRYQTKITDRDSLLIDPPLVISSNHDLAKISRVVNGPLLLDGEHIDILWRDTGSVIVKGDFQTTGDVSVEGVELIVSGEVKLLDKTRVRGCNVFSSSRIFIGDQTVFEGNALALRSIAVYGRAEVRGKSSLVTGSNRSSSGKKSSVADSLKFSIFLSEESVIDAVCIALQTPGSIKTDPDTYITGILWAQHLVCHRGRMAGLIYAGRLVDCDDPIQMATSPEEIKAISTNIQYTDSTAAAGSENKKDAPGKSDDKNLPQPELFNCITGDLEPLPDIMLYHLPFFIGRLSIVAWEEK